MALVFVRRANGTGALIPAGDAAPRADNRLVTTGGWTAAKRDGSGQTHSVQMGRDPQGNYRPFRQVVTSCRMCGGNNYSVEYSTCSRCG